jgi:hypothetical protein
MFPFVASTDVVLYAAVLFGMDPRPPMKDKVSKTHHVQYICTIFPTPVTVAARSKAWTIFARSESGIVVSYPTQGMDVWYVYAFFCVYVVLCLGSGLATGQSLVQGVLPSVKWLKRLKENLDTRIRV